METGRFNRIDQLAEDIGVTRTAIIEQALKNDLPQQESFHRALENPLVRAVHARLTTPAVLRLIAKLANEEISDEELAAIVERAPEQRAAAKRRRSARGSSGDARRRGSTFRDRIGDRRGT